MGSNLRLMVRARILLAAAAALVAAALPAAPAGAATQNVTVRNFVFEPAALTAAAGDTITWSWAGGTHNVTAYAGATFSSGNRSSGSFSATYAGGAVAYRCTLHSTLSGSACDGMCGTITDDTTPPPAPAITSPAAGSQQGRLVTVTGTSSSDTTTVRVREGTTVLAEAAASAGSWSAPVSLAPGSHTLTATALDAAGNESVASASVTFTVVNDFVPPSVTLTAPANNAILFAPVTATGVASDDVAVNRVTVTLLSRLTFQVQSVTATCTGCGTKNATFTASLRPLPGVYFVWATARDTGGNETASAAHTIVVL